MLNKLTVLGRPIQWQLTHIWWKMSSPSYHDAAVDNVKLEAKKFQDLLKLSFSGICLWSCYLFSFNQSACFLSL